MSLSNTRLSRHMVRILWSMDNSIIGRKFTDGPLFLPGLVREASMPRVISSGEHHIQQFGYIFQQFYDA